MYLGPGVHLWNFSKAGGKIKSAGIQDKVGGCVHACV